MDQWDIPSTVRIVDVPEDSSLAGRTLEEARIRSERGRHLLAPGPGRATCRYPLTGHHLPGR